METIIYQYVDEQQTHKTYLQCGSSFTVESGLFESFYSSHSNVFELTAFAGVVIRCIRGVLGFSSAMLPKKHNCSSAKIVFFVQLHKSEAN